MKVLHLGEEVSSNLLLVTEFLLDSVQLVGDRPEWDLLIRGWSYLRISAH